MNHVSSILEAVSLQLDKVASGNAQASKNMDPSARTMSFQLRRPDMYMVPTGWYSSRGGTKGSRYSGMTSRTS